MPEVKFQVTDNQFTALTSYLREDVSTISEMILKDYVGAVERAYKQKLIAEAEAKVSTFTDESKERIAAFDEQKVTDKLALIAAEEINQPPK